MTSAERVGAELEVLGMDVGDSEDGAFWTAFLRSLLAGMLHGLLSADTPEQTLRTATAIAAMAVTQIGFGINDAAQLAQLEQGVRVRPLTEQ